MTTSDMVIQLCEKINMSVAELSRRIGQSSQNFSKKLKNTVNLNELPVIADVLGVMFEQSFTLDDGSKIKLSNIKEDIENTLMYRDVFVKIGLYVYRLKYYTN